MDDERLARLHILLVDDEPDVVRGITRVMHQRHPGWTVHMAVAVTDAMRILSSRGPDIDAAVCDINMPTLPGTSLLKLIQDLFPWIARITLSGMLDPGSILGASRFAEVHLCKPLPAERLCDEIIRLCRERSGTAERVPRPLP